MQNHILQLLQQHGFVVEESGCRIGLLAKNTSKMTINSSAAGNLYQARMGPNSNTKTPETHNLDAQTSSNYFEKKRWCYTIVNMLPSQLFWDIWTELLFYIQFLSLNICYVLYVLLWIKYWLMRLDIFSFHFNLKTSQHFRNSGCIWSSLNLTEWPQNISLLYYLQQSCQIWLPGWSEILKTGLISCSYLDPTNYF